MKKFQRETATQAADMPHRFISDSGEYCGVCSEKATTPLHSAWERQSVADAERAQHDDVPFAREIGS